MGFKAGAGLTIAMTQLPSLLAVAGGGHNFFERAVLLATQLGQIQYLVLAIGIIALARLLLGPRIRRSVGEAGDREICWGGAIDNRHLARPGL